MVLCLDAEHAARVKALADALERIGLTCAVYLLDESSDAKGGPAVLQTLGTARYVALGISAAWAGSSSTALAPVLQALTEMALSRPPERPFLLPLRLEPCPVPEALAHLQHVDLFAPEGVERLTERLDYDLRLFTDQRDGVTYPTVQIGGKTWLARNLDYDLDAHGVSWPVQPRARGLARGRLYTWEGARIACLHGWHLPTDAEWRDLALAVGGYRDMDEGYPGEGASVGKPEQAFDVLMRGGRSGFDAQLAGVRTADGAFEENGRTGAYWTSTAYEYNRLQSDFMGPVRSAWVYVFYTLSGQVQLRRDNELRVVHSSSPLDQRWGLSVRCVRDSDANGR